MATEWTVVCNVDVDSADIASVFLFDAGATAISETERNDRMELRAGFLDDTSARAAVTTINARIPTARSEALFDASQDDWIEAQRNSLSPTTIGQWIIRAPWHPVPAAPDGDIVIDPGAAFGHGAHNSTRLTAELMLRTVTPGDTVVDLGTGTGVLAILAAKAGATVRAIEVDPVAVEVAAQNIERNGVGNNIELACGDGQAASILPTDLVIANVTLDVHRLLAPTYEPSERIIVAGILCNQVAPLCDLLEHHQAKTISTAGDWAGVKLVSPQISQNTLRTAD